MYGGYQDPICCAIGEKIRGTINSAEMNPITHITVIDVGRFAFSAVSLMVLVSFRVA